MGNVIFTGAMNEVVLIFDLENIGRMYLISLLFFFFFFSPSDFCFRDDIFHKKKKN